MTNIVFVNQKDEVVGYKPRKEESGADITRAAGLIILNSKGEALIARRALNKLHSPGRWGVSAAGTVEEGDTYESCIIREAKEEIGLEISASELIKEEYSLRRTTHNYFSTIFSVLKDVPVTDFNIQEEEVMEIRWVDIRELSDWHDRSPEDFTPTFIKTLTVLRKKIGI